MSQNPEIMDLRQRLDELTRSVQLMQQDKAAGPARERFNSMGPGKGAMDNGDTFTQTSQFMDQIRPIDVLNRERVFPVEMTGSSTWLELTAVGTSLTPFIDGRTNTDATGPNAAIHILTSGTPKSGDRGIMLEIADTDNYRYAFLSVSAPAGGRKVLVKRNGGSDGSSTTYASYTYDIYDFADTGYATKLNGGTPLSVDNSPARTIKGPVTAAGDGTVGDAYQKHDGSYGLYSVAEKHSEGPCTKDDDDDDGGG